MSLFDKSGTAESVRVQLFFYYFFIFRLGLHCTFENVKLA